MKFHSSNIIKRSNLSKIRQSYLGFQIWQREALKALWFYTFHENNEQSYRPTNSFRKLWMHITRNSSTQMAAESVFINP